MKAELVELLDDDVCVLFDDDLSFDDDLQTNAAIGDVFDGMDTGGKARHGAPIDDIDEIITLESRQDKSMDATRVYLNELSRSQLLTADQEKNLRFQGLAGR